MKNKTVKIFSSIEELADYFTEIIKDNITIALSGGSTPKKIFKYIADNYHTDIKWNRLKFFFGDERCVPADSDESNYKMAKENLFEPVKINSENIFRIKGEGNPTEEAKRYSEVLKNNVSLNNGIPQFDLIMLGLGEDGHTASIFPKQIDIFHSNNFCEVAMPPESGQKRITLTGAVINNAKLIVFIVTGSNKSKIVAEILSNEKTKLIYPAALVNPFNGKLVWMLDINAAQLIERN